MRIKLLLLAWLSLAAPAFGQFVPKNDPAAEFTRKNPKFIGAFKSAVMGPSVSTVRILAGGHDVALGVVVGEEGWILTKANDLGGVLSVKFAGGAIHEAELIGVHVPHDLALLKIEAKGLVPIEFKESKVADVGSWVACVGLDSQPVAVGVVSVATRNMSNKGGPIVNLNTAPYMGVELEPNEGGGVKIRKVMPSTPASKNGIKTDDVVLTIAGKKVDNPDDFIKTIAKHKVGESVTLRIRRGTQEFDKALTLERRPPDRGNPQNKMGSELSSRNTGYATILQHDSVVKPVDCGGPIVDLEGRVLGINICRAGRVESWAVPSEIVKPVLADLMAGKHPPPKEMRPTLSPDQKVEKAKAAIKKLEGDDKNQKALDEARKALKDAEGEVKIARKKDAADLTDKLLSLMQQRLVLMNDVAGWKWNHRQETADPLRENEILTKLQGRAKDLKIEPGEIERFFKAQFEAARMLQDERIADWSKDNATPKAPNDLNKDLRPRIDRLNDELVETLAQMLRLRADAELGIDQRLRERSQQALAGKGISDAVRAKALEGLP